MASWLAESIVTTSSAYAFTITATQADKFEWIPSIISAVGAFGTVWAAKEAYRSAKSANSSALIMKQSLDLYREEYTWVKNKEVSLNLYYCLENLKEYLIKLDRNVKGNTKLDQQYQYVEFVHLLNELDDVVRKFRCARLEFLTKHSLVSYVGKNYQKFRDDLDSINDYCENLLYIARKIQDLPDSVDETGSYIFDKAFNNMREQLSNENYKKCFSEQYMYIRDFVLMNYSLNNEKAE